VKAILEKKSISNMPLAALFGKLHEHELGLDRLEKNEGREHKVRSLCLKNRSKKIMKVNKKKNLNLIWTKTMH
jgi:hypothetical protein